MSRGLQFYKKYWLGNKNKNIKLFDWQLLRWPALLLCSQAALLRLKKNWKFFQQFRTRMQVYWLRNKKKNCKSYKFARSHCYYGGPCGLSCTPRSFAAVRTFFKNVRRKYSFRTKSQNLALKRKKQKPNKKHYRYFVKSKCSGVLNISPYSAVLFRRESSTRCRAIGMSVLIWYKNFSCIYHLLTTAFR